MSHKLDNALGRRNCCYGVQGLGICCVFNQLVLFSVLFGVIHVIGFLERVQ
jgi:hypothetical protein